MFRSGRGGGLFRRKQSKPSPSVSADGYFQRTGTTAAAATAASTRRSRRASVRSARVVINAKVKSPTKKAISRSPSPIWFVLPEKRCWRRKKRIWREIRYLSEDLDETNEPELNSEYSDDQFDDNKLLLSGDFNVRSDKERTAESNFPFDALNEYSEYI